MPTSRLMNEINMPQSGAVFVPLVKMSHPSFADDLRVVADEVALTHNGEVYEPVAFALTLPEQTDERLPFMNWRIDGASQEIVRALRGITGSVTATVTYVLTSHPDIVELGPYDVEMSGIQYDAEMVSGTLSLDPVLDRPFGSMQFTPTNAPALF